MEQVRNSTRRKRYPARADKSYAGWIKHSMNELAV